MSLSSNAGSRQPSGTEIERLVDGLIVEPSTQLVLDRLAQDDREPWVNGLRIRCANPTNLPRVPTPARTNIRDADEALLHWTAAGRWLCETTTTHPIVPTIGPVPRDLPDHEGPVEIDPGELPVSTDRSVAVEAGRGDSGLLPDTAPSTWPRPDPHRIPERWQTDFLRLADVLPEPWNDLFPRAAVALQDLHANPGWRLNLPGYRIGSIVGHGGSGLVYDAIQESTGQRVAIKVMHPGRHDAESRARFLREGRLLGRLEHPGIVRVLDVGEWQQGDLVWPYLVTEFLDGRPLLALRGSREQRVFVFEEICKAVQHAHEHGIIHRDLHPGNILFGSDNRPRIVDFGIAKELEPARGEPQTHTGFRMGTFPYLSPEQASGRSHTVTTRADVYALGAILYELLLEAPAIETPPDGDPHAAVLAGVIVPPRQRDRSLPRDLEAIVRKAMRTRPEERYGSVQEFLDDVQRYGRREPVRARQWKLHYVLGRFVQRNILWVVPVLVVGIVLLVIQQVRRAEEAAVMERLRASLGPVYSEIARARDTLALLLGRDVEDHTEKAILDLFDRGYEELARIHEDAGLIEHMHSFQERFRLREQVKLGGDRVEIRRGRKLLLDFWKEAAAQTPDDFEVLNQLHIALAEYGDTFKHEGNHQEALRWYLQADEVERRVNSQTGRHRGWLFYSAIRLAVEYRDLKQPLEAAREVRNALDLSEALVREDKKDPARRHYERAVALNEAANLIWLGSRYGNHPRSHPFIRLRFLHARAAVEGEPTETLYRHTLLSSTLSNAEVAYLAGGDANARGLAESALDEWNKIVAKSPDSLDIRAAGVGMYAVITNRATLAGQLDFAQRCYTRGLEDLLACYPAPSLSAEQARAASLFLSSAIQCALAFGDRPTALRWGEERALLAREFLLDPGPASLIHQSLARGLVLNPTCGDDIYLALRLVERLLREDLPYVTSSLEVAAIALVDLGFEDLAAELRLRIPQEDIHFERMLEILEPAIANDPLIHEPEQG